MYKSRNRLVAIFNTLLSFLMMYILFFKYSYSSLNMIAPGVGLYIGPIILIICVGIINIVVGITNNKDSISNLTVFVSDGIIELIMALFTYFQLLNSANKLINVFFIALIIVNFLISLLLLFRNLNLSDSNYEFKDKPASIIFKLGIVFFIAVVIYPIGFIMYLNSLSKNVIMGINKETPFYLIVNNETSNLTRFLNSQGEEVSTLEATKISQLKTMVLSSGREKMVYCIAEDAKYAKLVNIADGEPVEVAKFKKTKQFNVDNFGLFEEAVSSIFRRNEQISFSVEKQSAEPDYIEFVEIENLHNSKYEIEEEDEYIWVKNEETGENEYVNPEFEYKYFVSSEYNDIAFQVVYYSYQQTPDKFLTSNGKEEYIDFYSYKKVYYLIDIDTEERTKLDVENLIYGGQKAQRNGNPLDILLIYTDDTIPFKSTNETGYISIYDLEKTTFSATNVILDKEGSMKLVANISTKNVFINIYVDNEIQTKNTSYKTVYCLNDLFIFEYNGSYIIYTRDGVKRSARNYTSVYTLGGNVAIAGVETSVKDETGKNIMAFDIFNESGIMNEEPIYDLDSENLQELDNFKYNGVFKNYLN